MVFSLKAEAVILKAEAVILKAKGTVNKKLVGLQVNNSAEVKQKSFIPTIFFYLYLIAGRSCYPEGKSDCK